MAKTRKKKSLAKRQEKAVKSLAKKGVKVGKTIQRRNDAMKDVLKGIR